MKFSERIVTPEDGEFISGACDVEADEDGYFIRVCTEPFEGNAQISPADDAWVNQQIEESVSNRSQRPTPPPPPPEGKLRRWFKKNETVLRVVGPFVGASIGVVLVTLIGWATGLFGIVIDSQVNKVLTARLDTAFTEKLPYNLKERYSSLETDVENIDTRLARIEAMLDRLTTLRQIADAKPSAFANSLPQLRRIISDPKASADSTTLKEIARKLSETPQNSPEYWPTVLRFIQFASSSASSSGAPPPGPPHIRVSGSTDLKFVQSNARVLLDGGGLVDSEFRNSRIIFTEKPVAMRNVKFIDCVFEMPFVESPSQYLKGAAQQLLASDFMLIKRTGD